MKVLVLYENINPNGGFSKQGYFLYKGLQDIGVDVHAVDLNSPDEKEKCYRRFKPDVVVGIGCWRRIPELIFHPKDFGVKLVPWLVADGYIADYHEALNTLPLILVTSNWVKELYIRDGINCKNIDLLPIGCDTDFFTPHDRSDPKAVSILETLGVAPDHIMILTVGGDATTKGAQEVMEALSLIDNEVPDWKYVCKVWPQDRTRLQNLADLQLATNLGIEKKVIYISSIIPAESMPYLYAACDIYASPSRQEGFGIPAVEANACGKPVLAISAMGFLDTMVHEKNAMLAGISLKTDVNEVIIVDDSGFENVRRICFDTPRIVDYRASVYDIAEYLLKLMSSPALRKRIGDAGRKHVVKHFDYRVIAKKLVDILSKRLGIS